MIFVFQAENDKKKALIDFLLHNEKIRLVFDEFSKIKYFCISS